ncbi:MAG: MraY family glycosyltransferase [Candidatus Hydrogenedentota bacterium]
MFSNPYVIYAYALVVSFLLAAALTEAVRRFALHFKIMDQPGDRKMHHTPVPLLGGVAIVLTFILFLGTHLVMVSRAAGFALGSLEDNLRGMLGEDHRVKLAGIVSGGLIIFALGLWDDLRALRPRTKLMGQVLAALLLVFCGLRIRMFLFDDSLRPELLALVLSGGITVFWVVLVTNSLNLLDNMDGLCGGVSIIAALSFFLAVQSHEGEQEFVRLLLMVFAGSVGGFIYHNLSPARIFMGDAGAMFSGYFLATVALLGTFHVPETASRVAVAAPILALAVPLFDTASVVLIRWRSGESIWLGDKRHFSHRLVELGMTPRQAVEFIFLVAGVVGLGGALLSLVNRLGTFIILAQTAGVFLLIVLLMNASRRQKGQDE